MTGQWLSLLGWVVAIVLIGLAANAVIPKDGGE